MNSFGLDFCNFLFSFFIIVSGFFFGFFCSFLITLIINRLFKKKLRLRRYSFYGGLFYLIVFVTISLAITYNIKKTEYSITTQNKFKNSDSYKIALISDLHYNSVTLNERYLKEICNMVSNEYADIVLLCGDIIDENTTYEEMVMVFDQLSKINNKYGIYFVYGNHDNQEKLKESCRHYNFEDLRNTIENNGIIILKDTVTTINDEILLVGRDTEINEDRLNLDSFKNELSTDNFKIMMSHEPVDYDEASGFDLALSGHTHNGQVWPFNWVLSIKYKNKLMYGINEIDDLTYIVSSGVGTWAFPVRNTAPSEYVIINVEEGN